MEKIESRVDQNLYPFKSRFLELSAGKMHFIDEGNGETLLFIHGTPTWSFLYRSFIQELSNDHRCIAPDHIGFGLSGKPLDFPGTPEAHADNLNEFIAKLDLQNVTIIVHDFGGPIGLATAMNDPDRIKRVVLFNTWLWETQHLPAVKKIDKIVNSWLGRWMYLNMNFSPKVLLKQGFSDKRKLTKTMHQHYIIPFPNPQSRRSLLNIAKSLAGSSDWFEHQWQRLQSFDKPFCIIWGMKDTFITSKFLEKWKSGIRNFEVHELDAGHFIQEEKPIESINIIRSFMER